MLTLYNKPIAVNKKKIIQRQNGPWYIVNNLSSLEELYAFYTRYDKIYSYLLIYAIEPVHNMICNNTISHIDGLMQERRNSIANALSCTNPSKKHENDKCRI